MHKKVAPATEVVRGSDVIVRAVALDYAIPPETNKQTGRIRFNAVEVVRCNPGSELVLDGELVDRDDFNVRPVPYDSPRANGLAGSCYAWQYRTGQQYLLM
ncbi:MAG: hypothetical protein JOZ22_00005, partial [Acidobacteriia bacterium]|nr:hypothetical protein [Terriglobia bacterium]